MIQTALGLFVPYGRLAGVLRATRLSNHGASQPPLNPAHKKTPLCEVFVCVVPRGGIEPPTRGFSVVCVTDSLIESMS
jgi:hypothetical protein